MAIGKASDFEIHEDHVYGGMFESLEQNITAFNAASRGAIVLATEGIKGDYDYTAFYQTIASLVTRRDTTSTSAATALKMTEDEYVGVKINRKAGPVEMTGDAFRKKGLDPAIMSFLLGQEIGLRRFQDMVNTSLLAVAAALESQAALTNDASGNTITHARLNTAFSKRGDKAGEIVAVAIHSKPHYDLVGESFSSSPVAFQAGALAVGFGSTSYHGRVPIIIDAPALTDANGSLTDTYNTLGLVPGAVSCIQSEPGDMIFEKVGGNENIHYRFQSEWAYNLRCLGFEWDVANGGANPTDATIGTTTNWDQVDTDDKTLPGVLLVTD